MILIGRLRDNSKYDYDEKYEKDYREEKLNSSRKSVSPRKYENSLSKRFTNNKDSGTF
jgi:hypothetical protein